jgi:hypothetical protein
MDDQRSSKKIFFRQPGDWPGETLLAANVQALRDWDPDLADRIAAAAVPETVERVLARDGHPSFRFLQGDGRRLWLGHTSVPSIAARANLARLTLDGSLLVMNGIGSGLDARLILEVLGPHQALLILESNPLFLNLAFQLHDYTEALRIGRLVLLAGPDPEVLIRDFYRRHPGYNLISRTIAWPWLSEQQNRAFAQQVTVAVDACTKEIMGAIQSLREQIQQRDSQTSLEQVVGPMSLSRPHELRVANCTNSCSGAEYYTSRDLLAGFGQAGAATDWMVFDRPDKASQQAQLRRLLDFQPHLILLVDLLRGDLPYLPGSALCATILRNPPASLLAKEHNPAGRMGRHDFIFASQQEQIRKLQEAGVARERVEYLPPAADVRLFHPAESDEPAGNEYACEAALVSGRASSDPLRYQITLSSHQQLWQAILDQIRSDPAGYHWDQAPKILRKAQQCGVKITEEDIHATFVEIIQKHLGETVMRDAYCLALDREGVDLKIWEPCPPYKIPSGGVPDSWAQSPVVHRVAGTIQNGPDMNRLYHGAKIHLSINSTGYPDSHLWNGLAAGAFFLVKNHPRIRDEDRIGQFFDLEKELVTFESPQDLIRKIRYFLSHEPQREKIARAAREKVCALHSTEKRARQILHAITSNIKV